MSMLLHELQEQSTCFYFAKLVYTAIHGLVTEMDGEHRETDRQHTKEARPEVYGDTETKRQNSYQFYSCLQNHNRKEEEF